MLPAKPPQTLRRSSSRIKGLDGFLQDRLRGAMQYDRIAGRFRSSIFEIAAEELVTVGRVRFVCNSDLSPADLRASKEARTSALLQKWWAGGTADASVELDTLLRGDRYCRLKHMLQTRDGNGQPRVEIKVIDRVTAPLLHGKAGVITLVDGRRTCFMGSINDIGLKPVIDCSFPLDGLADAFRYQESGAHFGKICLEL